MTLPRTRQSWEPAARVHFYAALAANQAVPTGSQVVLSVTAANKGSAAATLAIYDGATQIASVQVPANDSRVWPGYPGVLVGNLNVTPSAAMDITVTSA